MGRMLFAVWALVVAGQAAGQTGATLDPETEVRVSLRDRLYHAEDCADLPNMRTAMPAREAEAKGYTPHAACLSRLRSRLEAAARSDAALKAWTECTARTVPRFGRVKTSELSGAPEQGSDGSGGQSAISAALVTPDGKIISDGGIVRFRRGELVKTEVKAPLKEGGSRYMDVTSLLRHNITRGRGAFEHQSAEHVRVGVALTEDCANALHTWNRLFESVTEAAATRVLKDNPSGVLVDEVSQGMTRADVEGILGPPERKATVGGRVVYFYPRMKVTFVAGKVTNVE